MKSHRICIVRNNALPTWVSCRRISTNIFSSYELITNGKDLIDIQLDCTDNLLVYEEFASTILGHLPETISFIEHDFIPTELIKNIYKLYKKKKKKLPELVFHVYGDFILRAETWLSIENELKKFSVKFLCASTKQQALLQKLIRNQACVYYLPFSVDPKAFYFDRKLREDGRALFKLDHTENVFLYAGRLSYQKNVLEVIQTFVEYLNITKDNAKLFITGSGDDIGVPYLQQYYPEGHYNCMINTYLNHLPNSIADKIIYLGNLDEKKLNMVLNTCDCYINLSVHNDEDYGMAPAEAFLAGLPCILSDWGGLSSFKLYDYDNYCSLIPVKIKEDHIEVDTKKTIKDMFYYSSKEFGEDFWTREKISRCYKNHLSIKATSKQLNSILSKPKSEFTGFSKDMRLLKKSDVFYSPYKVFSTNYSYTFFSNLYRRLYSSYE